MSDLTVSVKLTDNGEIPVPEEMRRAVGLELGQSLRLRQIDRQILVEVEERQIAGAQTLPERAARLVMEARLQASRDMADMTPEEAWAAYDAAAEAARKSLSRRARRKRAP